MSVNKKSIYLITGGTGSFGNAMLNFLLRQKKFSEIRILSRDEKKQEDLRIKLNDKRIKFYISDVRDKKSIINAFDSVDYVFHAAALKQVPSCEFYPLEAVKTNILGTENVIDCSIAHKVNFFDRSKMFWIGQTFDQSKFCYGLTYPVTPVYLYIEYCFR